MFRLRKRRFPLSARLGLLSGTFLALLVLAGVSSIAIIAASGDKAFSKVQAVTAPPGASVSTKVIVPAGMRSSPFDVDRYLTLPPNFSISVYARIGAARFMAVAPNGDLLVSQPSADKVLLVRPNAGGAPLISDFVTGLSRPHDIVFHTINATTYVYISETNQVNRFIYNSGDLTAHDRQVVVSGLPDSSTPELGGAYGHELKNIALDSNHKLYVSIASTCNACLSDTTSDPLRGAIYQYDADGSNRRFFARGLRNAEGLAFVPGTTDLWVAVNNRDNIAYPYNDGTGNYGKVFQSYVDNHPPEEFTRVRDGGNYGWPFCNPNPDTANGYDNMPFDRDYEFNRDGAALNCDTADRINKGIQAHSAPLGLLFLQDTAFAQPYRAGAVIGLHGSWNRSQKTGYKVIYFPWDSATQTPGAQIDLVTGWLNDATQQSWGRPVDVAVDQQGNMFISDDASGTIYKLTYTPPTPPTPTSTATPTATSASATATPTSPATATPTSPATATATAQPSATPTGAPTATATASPSTKFQAKINFQPSASSVPAGYLKDDGAVYGNRGNGYSYGWNLSNTENTRDRNASNSADQRYDTLIHLQKPSNPNASWEIAVPNGTYKVRLVAGDPSYIDSIYKINVEGVLVINGTPGSAKRWLDATGTVTVRDGKLTVTNASGSSNNKLCFIELTQQ